MRAAVPWIGWLAALVAAPFALAPEAMRSFGSAYMPGALVALAALFGLGWWWKVYPTLRRDRENARLEALYGTLTADNAIKLVTFEEEIRKTVATTISYLVLGGTLFVSIFSMLVAYKDAQNKDINTRLVEAVKFLNQQDHKYIRISGLIMLVELRDGNLVNDEMRNGIDHILYHFILENLPIEVDSHIEEDVKMAIRELLRAQNFRHRVCEGQDHRDKKFKWSVDFIGLNLQGADLRDTYLGCTYFKNVDLRHSDLRNLTYTKTATTLVEYWSTRFGHSAFDATTLAGAALIEPDLDYADQVNAGIRPERIFCGKAKYQSGDGTFSVKVFPNNNPRHADACDVRAVEDFLHRGIPLPGP